jgi:hypothetical protein
MEWGINDEAVVAVVSMEVLDGSRTIAGNCILPTSILTNNLKDAECFGASLLAASTVTQLHSSGVIREESGVQCRVVAATGSVRSSRGVS